MREKVLHRRILNSFKIAKNLKRLSKVLQQTMFKDFNAKEGHEGEKNCEDVNSRDQTSCFYDCQPLLYALISTYKGNFHVIEFRNVKY